MRVLLVGAGGNIGSGIEPALLAAGHEIIPVKRSGNNAERPFVRADFSNATEFQSRLAEEKFDAAICMIGMNARDAALMMEVCKPKGAHLLWTSTVCVFGGPLSGGIADDATERRPISDYGWNKKMAEDLLLESASTCPITIIRPASTGNEYFPILRQLSVTNSWLNRIDQGKPVLCGEEGALPWSWSTAADVGSAYALAVGDERAFGKAYTVTRPEPITWNDWHQGVAAVKGKPIDLCPVPASAILESGVPHGLLEEQSQWSQAFSPAKFQRDFPEWQVRNTFEGAIARALRHQTVKLDEQAEVAEDQLIAAYTGLGRRPPKPLADPKFGS